MTDELKFSRADDAADHDSLGEPLVSLIRGAYTPPDAAAWPDVYWSGLERRIMARVAADEKSWWAELLPWARLGLVAAAAIFAAAGIVNQQMAEPVDQVAYEAVAQPDLSSAYDEPIASEYVPTDNDAASLRYFLIN